MEHLSIYEIIGLYAIGLVALAIYRMSKRHGAYEWEKKMAPGHYHTRLGALLMLWVAILSVTTVIALFKLYEVLR